MKVQSRQDVKDGKIFVNVILTTDEMTNLSEGQVLNEDTPELSVQVVGYGEE